MGNPLCGASPAEQSGARVLRCAMAQRLVVNARAASRLRVRGLARQGARGGCARQGALALPNTQAA